MLSFKTKEKYFYFPIGWYTYSSYFSYFWDRYYKFKIILMNSLIYSLGFIIFTLLNIWVFTNSEINEFKKILMIIFDSIFICFFVAIMIYIFTYKENYLINNANGIFMSFYFFLPLWFSLGFLTYFLWLLKP